MRSLLRNVLSVATLAAVISAPASAFLSGVKNSLDIGVIEQAKDVYFDEIAKLINNLTIPDIYLPDDKGYMLDNKFVLQMDSGDVNFSTDVSQNAVIFSVTDFRGTFFCDHFRYKETIFVAKGSIEVDMKKI